MRTSRNIDCVNLKEQIHAKLDREYRGLTDEQIRRRIQHELATSDSPVARLWRNVVARQARTKRADADVSPPRRRRKRA